MHIRFELREGLLYRIYVVDDGRGMDASDITRAMTLGRPNTGAGRLGHFGVGLKSASFSQASFLTVLSRKRGCQPAGRRLSREGQGDDGFECDVLEPELVARALDRWLDVLELAAGTVIRWDDLRGVPLAHDIEVTTAFIERSVVRLRHHLGLTFHRLLGDGKVNVGLDVYNSDSKTAGLQYFVEPLNPFGYIRAGAPGYPKTLRAKVGGSSVQLVCHIWPPGSDSRFFKLLGKPAEQFQGFYLYRGNRLLTAGSWCGVLQDHRRRGLARVAVDIDGHLDHFTMATEKSAVHMTADLVRGIEAAKSSDGTTFSDYLTAAETVFRTSSQRRRKKIRVAPPGRGLHSAVRRSITRLADIGGGAETVEIRWRALSPGQFVEVDREEQTLWMNSEYRDVVLRGGRGSLNDAPLLKATLFLLYQELFQGAYLGPADKDKLRLWSEVLAIAVDLEREEHDS